MYLSESYKNRIKELSGIKNFSNDSIICYHRSNELEHMIKSDFSPEMGQDVSLFGPAIYFSESPNISSQLGKYICKFSIELDEPILDMNMEIDALVQKKIADTFNSLSKNSFETGIDDKLYPGIQFGDVLVEIAEQFNWDYNRFFPPLIQSFGYKSFKYYSNYHTDFVNKNGDFGLCYGLYNTKSIKFVDGPF